MQNDTIYALSTPLGNGIAILRLSGPRAKEALRFFFSRKSNYVSHHLYYGTFLIHDTAIDEGMAVWMGAPHSYTGEDCVEFHCHGSRAVIQALMQALSEFGLRIAQPGEFSRRAFENGRMDLAQAEAVMDLINADASNNAKSALSQLQGHLSEQIVALQDQLTDAIAELEAAIDYPEEDWIEDTAQNVQKRLSSTSAQLKTIISNSKDGHILREGYHIALVGCPNVGKSTLFNSLLGTDRAIVTHHAGTTRDVLEESFVLNGYTVRLTDTAGIREAIDEVEQIGIARSRNQLQTADLILLLLDSSRPLSEDDYQLIQDTAIYNRLIVCTKSDMPSQWSKTQLPLNEKDSVISITTTQENGLQPLLDQISTNIANAIPSEAHATILQNQRHMDAARQAEKYLEDALTALQLHDLDCVSIDARRAWSMLGEITGLTVDEAIVDRIFSTFCLGK